MVKSSSSYKEVVQRPDKNNEHEENRRTSASADAQGPLPSQLDIMDDDFDHMDNKEDVFEDEVLDVPERAVNVEEEDAWRVGAFHEDEEQLLASSQDSQISTLDACMHLIKGNLGPGCLNLPHVFGLSGWLLGLILFLVVALQGIYSMMLLAECKQHLLHQQRQQQAQIQIRIQTQTRFPHHKIHTFMDVAQVSLGAKGHALVQVFLFVLQAGVCCVFLNLMATNLHAQFVEWSNTLCIGLVTICLLGIVLIPTLKGLKWLSLGANVLMVTAIGTAVVKALMEITSQQIPLPSKGTLDVGNVATFISSMFFSFEGIGLVLPVENSFVTSQSWEEAEFRNAFYRQRILPGAMSMVGIFFGLTGFFGSWGFPDIVNGSITAYLAETFPQTPWFRIVNSLVMVAVFLTFPLQLTPALEVLEEWTTKEQTTGMEEVAEDHEMPNLSPDLISPRRDDALLGNHVVPPSTNYNDDHEDDMISNNSATKSRYSWIIPRYAIVAACALVVFWVDDLGLLMALFGAVGQTGLAMMPCLCHLTLVREKRITTKKWKILMDMLTILFCTMVMLFGLVVSIQRILVLE